MIAMGRTRSGLAVGADTSTIVFGRAVRTARTHRTHRKRTPCTGSRGKGATKLSHRQTWVSNLVHGLSSEDGKLRVGIGKRQRHWKRLPNI